MGLPPKPAVIFLGAGASTPAGCPLMRGFIDRARDYRDDGVFNPSEVSDINAALELYDFLRRQGFSITEEDIDNVENLLSIADLSGLLRKPPLEILSNPALPDHLRRFIVAVITKSITIARPSSLAWLNWGALRECSVYAWLVAALAFAENRITVVTVNYDCLIEYACHCMGLPYTYSRQFDKSVEGVELLKLHGSTNWMQCTQPECERRDRLLISPIRHRPRGEDSDYGYIEPEAICDLCQAKMTPLIVPPTWAKQIGRPVFQETWSRAAQALAEAESLVTIGYSLPAGDAHVRELLHVGLSSAKLRRALIIVGGDQESAHRWSNLFRQSWRQNRLTVEPVTFQKATKGMILNDALGNPGGFGGANRLLLPIKEWMRNEQGMLARLREPLLRHGEDPNMGINWSATASAVRTGGRFEPEKYKQIWTEAGLNWTPSEPNLPVHGNEFPIQEAEIIRRVEC